MTIRRPAYLISYREARAHAIIVASLGWLAVVAFVAIGDGDRSVFGPLKWSDFVHFYALGDAARTGDAAALFDSHALYARQSALVPAAKGDGFVAVYGPQTALIFAPFSLFDYVTAGTLWTLLTLAVYCWAVRLAWSPLRSVLPDRTFVTAAALAFPPVWQLAMYGQTTAVVLLGFAGGLWALERRRPVLAGVALSLIAIKPQWALLLVVVTVFGREWKLIAGALVGLSLQAALVVVVFGPSVLSGYAAAIARIPRVTGLLEPDAYKMHSLTALTSLFPGPLDWIIWAVLTLIVATLVTRTWRDARLSTRMRFGVLIAASALVNPHLTVYDAAVLVLPAVLIGGELSQGVARGDSGTAAVMTEQGGGAWFWQRCYWIAWALLLPTAKILKVQATPILLAELLFRTMRAVRSVPAGAAAPATGRT